MSSVDDNDLSCWNDASRLSCDAMVELAKREAERNFQYNSIRWADPACERYSKVRDVHTEMETWKGIGLSKEHCFVPEWAGKSGSHHAPLCQGKPWVKAPFSVPLYNTGIREVRFLVNTKRR